MPFEVVMPRLGWSMETGRLVEWFKQDGEYVEAGENLLAVEGEKAIQEVEALESGYLRIPPDSPPVGEEIPVGTLLAYLVQPDEAAPFETETSSTSFAPKDTAPRGPEPVLTKTTAISLGSPSAAPLPAKRSRRPAISPRARRVATELGIDWTKLKGSGRTGRIVERDVRQAAQVAEQEIQIKVSPVARRLAAEADLDLAELAAQKPGLRIQREDVEAAIAAREVAAGPSPAIRTAGEARPITQIRRVIAQRMVEGVHTTAPVTLNTEADATELVTLREQLKATLALRDKVVPSYNDLIIKLTGVVLQEHPLLNSFWDEADIFIPADIHIALAVDTEAGLLAPVIRNVPAKSLQQIALESRSLAERARAHQIETDELQGGTFTITNLGVYGIDAFTPIINLPQCAILGVGRIISKPAVWHNQVVPRHMMALSLTFDHRVVDGGPAARFLNTIREYVEQPYLWLTA
jgi:pyruvate dehydrogenase E2 component (dihydrolipoamide acetyltransferase)